MIFNLRILLNLIIVTNATKVVSEKIIARSKPNDNRIPIQK